MKEEITNKNVKTVEEIANKLLGNIRNKDKVCEGMIVLVASTNEKGETTFSVVQETTVATDFVILSEGIMSNVEKTIATRFVKTTKSIINDSSEKQKPKFKKDAERMCKAIARNNPRIADLMPVLNDLNDKVID